MSALLEKLTGLLLLDPWMLLLLSLVVAGLALRFRRGRPSIDFAPGGLLSGFPGAVALGSLPGAPAARFPRSLRSRLLFLPLALQVLGLVLVVVALARPAQRVALPLETEGIDILLCIDVSSSMNERDLDRERTRLDVALDAAQGFISGRPDDRIGLVCFARYPDLRCPLTLDHGALKRLLSGVATVESDSPEDATGIGTAVARCAQVLKDGETRSKVVVLLTDGEENVATAGNPDEIAPLHAGQLCEQLGIRVYSVAAGVGATSQKGTPIDTSQVEDLSLRTGGQFYEARDAGAVKAVYATIDALEKAVLVEPRYEMEERFLPILLLAIGLLLVGRLLESTALRVLP